MKRAFLKLSKEDQKHILDSAFRVFTDIPYEKASTNAIVKMAGISKGMLFYYFDNKQSLFDYLVGHALDYVKEEYLDRLDFEEKDFIKRYVKISEIKKDAYENEPHLFAFLSYVYLHEQDRIPGDKLQRMHDYMENATQSQYKDIDTSLFRDDIKPERITELITYSIEGYQNKLIKLFEQLDLKNESMDKHYQDFYDFLEDLRKIYYK